MATIRADQDQLEDFGNLAVEVRGGNDGEVLLGQQVEREVRRFRLVDENLKIQLQD